MGVSRRAFLKSAAAAGGVVALAGASSALAEDAAPTEGEGEGSTQEEPPGMPGGEAIVDENWRTAPDPIPDDQIVAEYTADFIVVGAGHAGTNCARTLMERGRNVILIEKQDEESFSMLGNDIGHINSQMNLSFGVPEYDPIEFYNNWMLVSGNLAEPTICMQYAQRGGEAVDAFCDVFTDEEKQNFSIYFWNGGPYPSGPEVLGGQHFYYGCLNLRGKNCNMNMTEAYAKQREYMVAGGMQIDYSMNAQQLIQDADGKVCGVIAEGPDGYVKYNANVAVALCAGDFSANETMRNELLPNMTGILAPGESLGGMGGRDGQGIKMAYWVGGKLEAAPIATMGGDYGNPSGPLGNGGVPIWLDDTCKRYCNEAFGGPEIAGRPTVRARHTTKYCVFDSKCIDELSYGLPCHTAFDYSDQDSLDQLQEKLDGARDAGAEGYQNLYCADDLATLAGYLGLEGELADNFVASVEHYNEMCDNGRDEDFGRDERYMWKFEPPYYAQATSSWMIGMMMVTCGGLCCDGNSQVVDESYNPIPGLYAAGNNCGRRFGPAYFTPTAGASLGFAVTQGYVLGDYLATL